MTQSHRGGTGFIVREMGGLVLCHWSYVIGHWSLVDGGDREDRVHVCSNDLLSFSSFVRSNDLLSLPRDLALLQVTPSGIARPPVPSPSLDPWIARVMVYAITLLATTEVVTTNRSPINK